MGAGARPTGGDARIGQGLQGAGCRVAGDGQRPAGHDIRKGLGHQGRRLSERRQVAVEQLHI